MIINRIEYLVHSILSTCLIFCQSVSLLVCVYVISIFMSVSLFVCRSVYLSVCLYVGLSICLSVCLYWGMSICLSVSLKVCETESRSPVLSLVPGVSVGSAELRSGQWKLGRRTELVTARIGSVWDVVTGRQIYKQDEQSRSYFDLILAGFIPGESLQPGCRPVEVNVSGWVASTSLCFVQFTWEEQ